MCRMCWEQGSKGLRWTFDYDCGGELHCEGCDVFWKTFSRQIQQDWETDWVWNFKNEKLCNQKTKSTESLIHPKLRAWQKLLVAYTMSILSYFF